MAVSTANLKIDSINFNFDIVFRDGEEGVQQTLNDQVSLGLSNEKNLNKVLSEKPYMQKIATLLVSSLKKTYDPTNALAKKLLEEIAAELAK